MNLVLQQLPEGLKGSARAKYLAPEAAASLKTLEKDTDGLLYTDLWHCATASLLNKRTRRGSHLPGYSPHNFGLAIDLDLEKVLEAKKITYEDLLWILKRRYWFCHRRDGAADMPGSEHFNYLGEAGEECLQQATFDPMSWDKPVEARIFEKHGPDFSLSPAQIQSLLKKLGFFHGEVDGNYDIYFREAVMAFQRAWDLSETGTPTMTTQRTLAFVSAEVSFVNG